MSGKYYLILNIFVNFYQKLVQYNIIITDFNLEGVGGRVFFPHDIEKNYGTLSRLRKTENAHTLFIYIIRHLLNQNFWSAVDRTCSGGPVNPPTQYLDLNCMDWAVDHLKTLIYSGPSET